MRVHVFTSVERAKAKQPRCFFVSAVNVARVHTGNECYAGCREQATPCVGYAGASHRRPWYFGASLLLSPLSSTYPRPVSDTPAPLLRRKRAGTVAVLVFVPAAAVRCP